MIPRCLLSILFFLASVSSIPVGAVAEEAAAPAPAESAPAAPVKKKAAKKKKPYDYERSKYKSRELTDNTQNTYRFNEKGEPVVAAEAKAGAKKKAVPKKHLRSEPADEEMPAKPDACGPSESCAEKKAEDL